MVSENNPFDDVYADVEFDSIDLYRYGKGWVFVTRSPQQVETADFLMPVGVSDDV